MVICALSVLHNIANEEAVCSKPWVVVFLIYLSEELSAEELVCFSLLLPLLHIRWLSGLRFIHLTSLDSIFPAMIGRGLFIISTSQSLQCWAVLSLLVGSGSVWLHAKYKVYWLCMHTTNLSCELANWTHAKLQPFRVFPRTVVSGVCKRWTAVKALKILFIHTWWKLYDHEMMIWSWRGVVMLY